MAICYDRLWKILIDKKMNKTDLRIKTGIGTATLAKMSANENVSLDVLEKICAVLSCDIGDIVQYVPEEETEE